MCRVVDRSRLVPNLGVFSVQVRCLLAYKGTSATSSLLEDVVSKRCKIYVL